MNSTMANNIINTYAVERGYPYIEKMNLMDRPEFNKGLQYWPTEYLEALAPAGLYYNLTGKVKHPRTGEMVRSEWGWKMEQVKKTVDFRYTTEGKKAVLKANMPQAVRTEENDMDDTIDTASIKVSAETGNTKKDKRQTQLNIERMNHIRALEKSIKKGGALREMYDAVLNKHKDNVENLMTNEEAAKLAMKNKRRKKYLALLLSWFIMPLYVIFRSLDMILDAGIVSARLGYKGSELGPKVGSKHTFLGRFSIPITIATFISFITAISRYNAGSELYVEHGMMVSGLIFIPVYMIGFIIIKQFLDIPFIVLCNKYGIVAEWASTKFEPTAAEEFQLGGVYQTSEQEEILGGLIKEREDVINGLKDSIERNLRYSKYDTYRNDKNLSIKALEKEERETFGYR